ncbi:PfkB family carbohydrate kinase [Amycolatopsis jiangsuensis]|uniref:RfaE bifunctional protein nucleotidyltransferase chain/domain/rfaE bifunctional protein kinase chain/domain n=1 Tax=Amycolatopsis jiangsuensis TaxID=1181879 RepID=A0A840J6Z1_9PSEU|nr:PfkB family carbohydrate kinase [Amycolatopsis jiangsuensis]MBB4689147.1 rfaE bifunctional protein nucleotidyltransferase chain/domain/rfaE bifunctional protein kinase chain/domain [Amycolatopsis jiangsuensis]
MKPLVVVGDTFLDVDAEGTADRLCPDAPVPVVDVTRQWLRPGGAGLAAVLAARSTSDVVLVTALGDDPAGRTLAELLGCEATVAALPLEGGTVSKTRVRAAGQSLLRMDSGDGIASAAPLPSRVKRTLRGAGAILVADYGRGLTRNPSLRALLTELAGEVPIVWDPHPRGAAPVPGVRLVTPNSSEAETIVPEAGEPVELARKLRGHWSSEAVAVTLGHQGAALHDDGSGGRVIPVPETARVTGKATPDTCGAGDRFAAAAAATLLDGATADEAVRAAVEAAARFVAAGGAGALSVEDVRVPMPAGDAFALAAQVRASGGQLVATGGCFDLLHPGHISLLRQARALGDALVVCLNSDRSVSRLKGPGRPLLAAEDRARLLSELCCVDAVAVFDEPSPAAMLERLRPQVWVKGGDYADVAMPEREVVARHGGEVVLVPTLPGYSTTRLVAAAAGQ